MVEGALNSGVWEAEIEAETAPALTAWHDGRELDPPEVSGGGGRWRIRLALPAEVLSDGLQTVVLRDGETTIATIPILAGRPLDPDIRAEIDLLRAELDLLKRAFRRHAGTD